jgi:hypothetical protein
VSPDFNVPSAVFSSAWVLTTKVSAASGTINRNGRRERTRGIPVAGVDCCGDWGSVGAKEWRTAYGHAGVSPEIQALSLSPPPPAPFPMARSVRSEAAGEFEPSSPLFISALESARDSSIDWMSSCLGRHQNRESLCLP